MVRDAELSRGVCNAASRVHLELTGRMEYRQPLHASLAAQVRHRAVRGDLRRHTDVEDVASSLADPGVVVAGGVEDTVGLARCGGLDRERHGEDAEQCVALCVSEQLVESLRQLCVVHEGPFHQLEFGGDV